MLLKLIVGLGNPGAEYAHTRHNAGFWFVEELARRHGGVFRPDARHQGDLARVRIAGAELWLLKPMTFMNRSGGPTSSVLNFYKAEPGEMLVAHDEIDLPLGAARLKQGGGHGGNNGLRDVIAHLGPEFVRLRIGVAHPGDKEEVADYLLRRVPVDDERVILGSVIASADVMPELIENGLQKATNLLHAPKEQGT